MLSRPKVFHKIDSRIPLKARPMNPVDELLVLVLVLVVVLEDPTERTEDEHEDDDEYDEVGYPFRLHVSHWRVNPINSVSHGNEENVWFAPLITCFTTGLRAFLRTFW